MTNRQILAGRVASRHAPALFDFAYPMTGRRLAGLRRLALRAWALSLRWQLHRAGL